MATTTSNDNPNSDSALLSLPAELRNRIYEYALTVESLDGEVSIRKRAPAESSRPSALALLQTCRQIYREARGVFYHENALHLRHCDLPSFVTSLSLARQVHIRSLRLNAEPASIGSSHRYSPAWLESLLLLPGLRRLRLDFTNSSAFNAFYDFTDERLRLQVQAQIDPPKGRLEANLLQLRGLTKLEFKLSKESFEVDEKQYYGRIQKALERANEAIGEAVLKPHQDA